MAKPNVEANPVSMALIGAIVLAWRQAVNWARQPHLSSSNLRQRGSYKTSSKTSKSVS
jgi:hypothetical protein